MERRWSLAKSLGHKYYFTGKPCSRGHTTKRFASSGNCTECHPALTKSWYEKNENSEGYKAKVLAAGRKWRGENRELVNRRSQEYKKNNRGKATALDAKYKASKKRAVPSWANLEAIKFFYQFKPEGFHVDHIVPLNSELVCGLHVEHNLQWLPARENILKGNKHWPNKPEEV